MLTPNHGCVDATDKFTCSNTRLFLAQTSLAVKKTTRTSGGDLISYQSHSNNRSNTQSLVIVTVFDLISDRGA